MRQHIAEFEEVYKEPKVNIFHNKQTFEDTLKSEQQKQKINCKYY